MLASHIPFYCANVIIHACAYAYFICAPFRDHLRFCLRKTIMLVAAWIVYLCVANLLFFEHGAPFLKWAQPMNFFSLFVSILFCVLAVKAKFQQIAFVIIIAFSIQNNLIMTAELINELKPFPLILSSFPDLNYLLYTIGVLIVFFPACWYLFAGMFRKVVKANINFTEWKYLFLLPMLYLVYSGVSGYGGAFTPPRPQGLVAFLLMNGFAYFSYIAVFKMLINSYEKYRVQEQINLLNVQLEIQKEQYNKLTENIQATARMRHDMRHHFDTMKGFTDRNDLAGLREYLQCAAADFPKDAAPVCLNPIVDILLKHYIYLAQKEQIDIQTLADLPAQMEIPNTELCILFGNLLENALEGCGRQT